VQNPQSEEAKQNFETSIEEIRAPLVDIRF